MKRAVSDKVSRIVEMIAKLDDTERGELQSLVPQVMTDCTVKQKPIKTILMRDFEFDNVCPHCSGSKIKPHGNYRGRKRYKCLSCTKTFNEFSGAAISGTHYFNKWGKFIECMASGLSIAKTSERIGVSIPTAFDWRHKLLKKYEREAEAELQGVVEADETFFLFSEKGSRKLSKRRSPRKRGGKAQKAGISKDQVPVIVGCDRKGNVVLGVAGRGRISMADVESVLNDCIDMEGTLCTDGHNSFKAYAKAYNLSYVGLNISKGRRVIKKKYHIQNVNNFHSRLKQWMVRFNGVSTKYLQNYMNWFSLLEETKSNSDEQITMIIERSVPQLSGD